MMAVALYYTDNTLPGRLAEHCWQCLRAAFPGPIVTVSQRPLRWGDTKVTTGPLGRSRHSMFKQIYAGLVAAYKVYRPDYVWMCEHDMLYPTGYFAFGPPDPNVFYYAANQVFMLEDGYASKAFPTLSGCVADFRLMLAHMALRLYRTEVLGKPKGGWTNSEPAVSKGDEMASWGWYSNARPVVDIRHGGNLSNISQETVEAQTIPYWGDHDKLKGVLYGRG